MDENLSKRSHQAIRYQNETIKIEIINHHGIECIFFDDIRQCYPKVTCLYIDDKQQSFLRDENGHRLEPLCIKACPDETMVAFESKDMNSINNETFNKNIQEIQKSLVLLNNEIQEKFKQTMTLTYELHEYTTPHYFYISQVQNDNQSLRQKFVSSVLHREYKLYFLCDCSDDPLQRHIAPHDGYIIKEPTKFITEYGANIRTTLNIIRTALPIVGRIVDSQIDDVPTLISDVTNSLSFYTWINTIDLLEHTLDEVEKTSLTTNTSNEAKIMTQHRHMSLHGASLRELINYLEGVDNKNSLGNLYRKITDDGHVRWVCLEHYDIDYHNQRIFQYIQQIENLGGKYNKETKEVVITSIKQVPIEIPKLNYLLKNGLKITKLIMNECCLKETDLNLLFDISINSFSINLSFSDVKIFNRFPGTNYICKSISIFIKEDFIEFYLPNRYTNGDIKLIIQFLLQNKSRRIINISGIYQSIDYENNFCSEIKNESKILIINHLNNIEILNQLLSSTISFTHLKLNYCYGSSTSFLNLCDLLGKHLTLNELDLINSTSFDDETLLIPLLKSLKNNISLKIINLNISNLHLTEQDQKEAYLIKLLNSKTFISHLYLLNSNITLDFVKAIIDNLNKTDTLKYLQLYNCTINDEHLLKLVELFSTNNFHFIKSDEQYFNVISNQITELINKEYDQDNNLEIKDYLINDHLDLSDKQLFDKDMIILYNNKDIIKRCKQISLNNNQITSVGILILTDLLFNNINLEKLNFNSNNLCDGGLYLLMKILMMNKNNFQQIYLKSNEITDEGINYLIQILKSNKNLTHLDLSDNYITDNGLRKLIQIINDEKIHLKYFLLDENKEITDSSISLLISMIKNNKSIENLSLINCNINERSKNKLRENNNRKNIYF